MRSLKVTISSSVFVVLFCSTAFAQRPFDVKWVNEQISVHASDASLADVIGEVARLTGIEVTGGDKLIGRISVDFANLAPKEALSKILTGVNYVVQERPAAKGSAASPLVVSVHSMAGDVSPANAFSGPLEVPTLIARVAAEAADVDDGKEIESDDDPDAVADEVHEDKLGASRLTNEGAFGPKATVGSLIKLMDNYNDEIRVEALKALASRPMQAALTPLVKALGDEAWDVRTVAVEALGRASDRGSLRAVGKVLEKSDDDDARLDALRVLAQRGDPESVPYLKAVLKDADSFIRETAERMLFELDRREQAKQAAKTNEPP